MKPLTKSNSNQKIVTSVVIIIKSNIETFTYKIWQHMLPLWPEIAGFDGGFDAKFDDCFPSGENGWRCLGRQRVEFTCGIICYIITLEKNDTVSSIKHCLTKEYRQDKEMQCLTLQTHDNHALSRLSSKVNFGGQMHTLDLQVRIFVQYPIGSASKTCVLVLPPTTKQLKNLVISYQVPSVN